MPVLDMVAMGGIGTSAAQIVYLIVVLLLHRIQGKEFTPATISIDGCVIISTLFGAISFITWKGLNGHLQASWQAWILFNQLCNCFSLFGLILACYFTHIAQYEGTRLRAAPSYLRRAYVFCVSISILLQTAGVVFALETDRFSANVLRVAAIALPASVVFCLYIFHLQQLRSECKINLENLIKSEQRNASYITQASCILPSRRISQIPRVSGGSTMSTPNATLKKGAKNTSSTSPNVLNRQNGATNVMPQKDDAGSPSTTLLSRTFHKIDFTLDVGGAQSLAIATPDVANQQTCQKSRFQGQIAGQNAKGDLKESGHTSGHSSEPYIVRSTDLSRRSKRSAKQRMERTMKHLEGIIVIGVFIGIVITSTALFSTIRMLMADDSMTFSGTYRSHAYSSTLFAAILNNLGLLFYTHNYAYQCCFTRDERAAMSHGNRKGRQAKFKKCRSCTAARIQLVQMAEGDRRLMRTPVASFQDARRP